MPNETKKYYGSIEAFRQFLKNCKTIFAAIAHTHTKADITDFVEASEEDIRSLFPQDS